MRMPKLPSGCFWPLQRAITDFAADQPFAQVPLSAGALWESKAAESRSRGSLLAIAKTIS